MQSTWRMFIDHIVMKWWWFESCYMTYDMRMNNEMIDFTIAKMIAKKIAIFSLSFWQPFFDDVIYHFVFAANEEEKGSVCANEHVL